MSLAHGGHLTHGHPVSVTGRLWKAVQYGVRPEDGRIDYDQVEALAREHRPRLMVAGASAYPRMHRLRALRPRSRARWARCWWWTWRTSPGWSRPGCIRARCRTPTW